MFTRHQSFNTVELLVLQNAVIVLSLQSYSLVVQGITLLVLIKLSIVMCAVGHSQ